MPLEWESGQMTTMFDAAAVIGAGRPDDYLLSPIEHAERLRASAPKLATLLTRSAPVELAQQYADADTEALAAERMFKRWLTRANWTVLATATVSAVLMAVALDRAEATLQFWRRRTSVVLCGACRGLPYQAVSGLVVARRPAHPNLEVSRGGGQQGAERGNSRAPRPTRNDLRYDRWARPDFRSALDTTPEIRSGRRS